MATLAGASRRGLNVATPWIGAVLVLVASAFLLMRARRFDFFCDDAFITLRYSRNFVHLGAPIYNPGEYVEGYTSFLWMSLVALQHRLGVDPLVGAQRLGGFSAVATLAATWMWWRRLEPRTPWIGGAFVLAFLASSAPLAAWTFGGLETVMFAAFVVLVVWLSASTAADVRSTRGRLLPLLTGVTAGLSVLVRPEGALIGGIAFLVTLAYRVWTRDGRRALALVVLGGLLVVGPFLAFRLSFYGYPFPNTFYLKSTGASGELLARGWAYLELAVLELGPMLVWIVGLSLLVPVGGRREGDDARSARRRAASAWIIRAVTVPYVAYVLRVGGDFLDLYRFLVPLFPLAFVSVAMAAHTLLAWSREILPSGSRAPRWVLASLAVGAASWGLRGHAQAQEALTERATKVSEPERARRHLEPLGWTRLYGLRWSAVGRWLAAHAEPGDTMAAGAAGAMPYYAGIPSLDLFGLCDEFIAHDGSIVGSRPGHQRFAPNWYIVMRKPTFLVFNSEDVSDSRLTPQGRDAYWNNQGWVWATAKVDRATYGGPTDLWFRLMIQRPRAKQLVQSGAIEVTDL